MNLHAYNSSDALFTGTRDIVAQADKLDYEGWSNEGKKAWNIRSILEDIGKHKGHLDLVFLTGNSYDWARGRIIENFALYDIPNINITVISENGLVAQSRDNGVYWIGDPSDEYNNSLDAIIGYAHRNFNGLFWLQGNMRRTSLKPVNSYTNFDSEFVPQVVGFAEAYGIIPFDIERGFGDEIGVIYHHPGSSIDIDPRKVIIKKGGSEIELDFKGKETAVNMLSEMQKYDSLDCTRAESDYPMIKAVDGKGGIIYLPFDHRFSDEDIENFKSKFRIQITSDTQNILCSVLRTYLQDEADTE